MIPFLFHAPNSTKQFVRWMHGTCVETPPQHAEGEDEPILFSFFSDIAHNSTIIELVQNISKTVQTTLGSLNKFLSRWKRYRVLWKLDKVSRDKLAAELCDALQLFQQLVFKMFRGLS